MPDSDIISTIKVGLETQYLKSLSDDYRKDIVHLSECIQDLQDQLVQYQLEMKHVRSAVNSIFSSDWHIKSHYDIEDGVRDYLKKFVKGEK